MLTLKEACNIMSAQYPESRITGGIEFDHYYGFSMWNRANGEWDGNKFTKPVGSSLDVIDRNTGKISWLTAEELLTESVFDNAKPVDVCPYLSDEDAIFAVQVQKKEEEFNRRLEDVD